MSLRACKARKCTFVYKGCRPQSDLCACQMALARGSEQSSEEDARGSAPKQKRKSRDKALVYDGKDDVDAEMTPANGPARTVGTEQPLPLQLGTAAAKSSNAKHTKLHKGQTPRSGRPRPTSRAPMSVADQQQDRSRSVILEAESSGVHSLLTTAPGSDGLPVLR